MPIPAGVGGNWRSTPRMTDSRWCCASRNALAFAGTFSLAVMTSTVQGPHPDRDRALAALHARAIDIDHLVGGYEILFLDGLGAGDSGPVRWFRDGVDHLIEARGCQSDTEGARCPLKKTSPARVPARSSRTCIFVVICHETHSSACNDAFRLASQRPGCSSRRRCPWRCSSTMLARLVADSRSSCREGGVSIRYCPARLPSRCLACCHTGSQSAAWAGSEPEGGRTATPGRPRAGYVR